MGPRPSERDALLRAAPHPWRGLHKLALAVVMGVLALAPVAIGVSRMYYEWPWSARPIDTLHACGRRFLDEGPMSRGQLAASGTRLQRVGSFLDG